MPVISRFFGIVIEMHYLEHGPPHFHAEYQGFEAVFDMRSGKLTEGAFPKRAQALVREWAVAHRGELEENWRRAEAKRPMLKIPGADQP